MFVLSLTTSVTCLYLTRRNKGPTWAMAFMWIVCMAPISLGVIVYEFVDPHRWLLDIVIAASIIAVAAGAWIENIVHGDYRAQQISSISEAIDFEIMHKLAKGLWVIGMIGGVCVVADFVVSGRGSLLNLAELRDSFVTRDSATIFGRVGSLLTWACLVCYIFALIFRDRMTRFQSATFMLPVGAFLLGGILSAGRQAAFQVLLFTIIGQALYRIRGGPRVAQSGRTLVAIVTGSMVSYMGFIAIARNDSRISDIKADVLARLFQYHTASWFDKTLTIVGSGIRNTIIEAVVYFTSSVALFDQFLDTHLVGVSYGAMNFPFLFRQLESVTGISVEGMYELKVATLDAQNVIGVGWTTTISHLIMDFGFLGTLLALFVQGYLGAWAWRRALTGGNLIDCILACLMTVAAVYLPLLPSFADTNLFLTLVFCFLWRSFGPRAMGMLGRGAVRQIEAA